MAALEDSEHPVPPKRPSKFATHKDAILEALAHGMTHRAACRLVGINHETLIIWIRTKPAFATEVAEATSRAAEWAVEAVRRAASEAEVIESFDRDGNLVRRITKYDWRAAAWFLEHHPEMRSDWKPAPTELSGPEGSALMAPVVTWQPDQKWQDDFARGLAEMGLGPGADDDQPTDTEVALLPPPTPSETGDLPLPE